MRFQTKPVAPALIEAFLMKYPARIGKQKGRAGDYLVTTDEGVTFEIVRARDFLARYEPVKNGNGTAPPARAPAARRNRARATVRRATAPPPAKSAAAPGKRGRGIKVDDATLARIRKLYESGMSVSEITKAERRTASSIYSFASASKWKRPAKGDAKKGAPAATNGAAPRFDEPRRLSGGVRCTSCESMTTTDPCEYCGNKLKKTWTR